MGFSLGKKRLAAVCPGRVSGACPPCVRLCPPLVRLVLLALAAPPVLVRHLSALCPPCVVGFGRASSPCPPLVRLVSALCCWPNLAITLICRVSGMCRPSAFSAPCVFHVSAMCPHKAPSPFSELDRHASAMCLPCVLHGSAIFALCVRHVSAPCLLFVLSLSACCSLRIRSLSTFVRVYALALAEPLSALCPLFDLCMVLGRALVCSVSSLVRLSRTLCLGIYFP